ncbi:unnamed protein product [Phytophthora fragariaefolia]|uniref:Unnamed protein product n=1 Tax=Phytophthora fragariaefolia TaxID=1490495 RepID=A0A9W7CZR7_9STRA|nr:unnamed protein product [Phytophthora fragariaefolia]
MNNPAPMADIGHFIFYDEGEVVGAQKASDTYGTLDIRSPDDAGRWQADTADGLTRGVASPPGRRRRSWDLKSRKCNQSTEPTGNGWPEAPVGSGGSEPNKAGTQRDHARSGSAQSVQLGIVAPFDWYQSPVVVVQYDSLPQVAWQSEEGTKRPPPQTPSRVEKKRHLVAYQTEDTRRGLSSSRGLAPSNDVGGADEVEVSSSVAVTAADAGDPSEDPSYDNNSLTDDTSWGQRGGGPTDKNAGANRSGQAAGRSNHDDEDSFHERHDTRNQQTAAPRSVRPSIATECRELRGHVSRSQEDDFESMDLWGVWRGG